ncbi:hypothetical protein AwErysi_08360 [Erysipelotrichaceae bacterium]|nr:hypothetical protein AwErysi_08360 [Erysipelotrichaceae bacterium]
MMKIVVFAAGNGSNSQAIADPIERARNWHHNSLCGLMGDKIPL